MPPQIGHFRISPQGWPTPLEVVLALLQQSLLLLTALRGYHSVLLPYLSAILRVYRAILLSTRRIEYTARGVDARTFVRVSVGI